MKEQLAQQAREQGYVEQRAQKCRLCGLATAPDGDSPLQVCPYCGGGDLYSVPRRIIRPFARQPFGLSRSDASKRLRAFRRRAWLAPGRVRKALASQRHLQGVYLPYWIFDCVAISRYLGERIEDSGEAIPAGGTLRRRFEDVLVPAGVGVDGSKLDQLDSWDLSRVEEAAPGPGEGTAHTMECYRLEVEQAFDRASRKLEERMQEDAREAIGGTSPQLERLSTQYESIAFRLLLFPIWIWSFRHKDQPLNALIDAQNGQIIGRLPRSRARIIGAASAVAALALAAVLLLSY